LLVFRSCLIIENDDFYESTVTSSLLYAKKNPPNKQELLLDIPVSSDTSEAIDESILQEREDTPSISVPVHEKETKKNKPQSLQVFYPEIPPAKKELSSKKRKKRSTKKQSSRTKQLLLEALNESKLQLQTKEIDKAKKTKKKSPTRMTRKQRKEYEQKKTVKLTSFIPQIVIKPLEHSSDNISKSTIRKSDQIPLLEDSDPYPFSTLIEWLIWHNSFPELAYVREAYDLDSVPQDSDEVYWINVMNEPEFFTSNWKVAGSRIYDLEGIRTRGPPGGEPEFNMDLVLTENGFSTLFSDVHMILNKMPDGLKNLRYPILQLALKGLLLLELAYMDENLRWFALGSDKDLKERLSVLDSFVGEQESRDDYEVNVRSMMNAEVWQKGIISFDLLIMKSMFLSTFSRTQIPAEIKIAVLNTNKFQQGVISRLNAVDQLDRLRVKDLIIQLSK